LYGKKKRRAGKGRVLETFLSSCGSFLQRELHIFSSKKISSLSRGSGRIDR
jgi:hypothetical protein